LCKVRVGGDGERDAGGEAGGAGEEAARGEPETLAEAGVAGAAPDDDVMEDPLVVRRGDRYGNIMNACRALAAQGKTNPTTYDATMEGIEDLHQKMRVHAVKLPVGRPPGVGSAAPLNPLKANEGRGRKDTKRKRGPK
jgi:hypothetical protein